jgi:hypothetical protein
MRWTGYVAHMGEIRNAYKFLDNLRKRGYFRSMGPNGRIIFN